MDASIIIAVSSVFIAACALGATIWQVLTTREHNRLSVRPKLTIVRRVMMGEGIANANIRMINSGVGPAIIENFVLLFKGKEISRNNENNYRKFMREDIEGFNCIRITHPHNGTIRAGVEITLCEFEYNPEIKSMEDIKELKFQIDYYSIYKDEIFVCGGRKKESE